MGVRKKKKNYSFISSQMLNISPNNNCLGCCPRGHSLIIALQGVTEGSFFLVWHLKPDIGVVELYNKLLDFIKVHG